MTDFASWQDYNRFSWKVMRHNRHIHDKPVTQFFDALLATASGHARILRTSTPFYRAQLGCDTFEIPVSEDDSVEEEVPYSAQRMVPLPDQATEGRANPKGIPYLYMATNRATAIAETRPWVGSLVSVGTFKLVRNVKVISFIGETDPFEEMLVYLYEPSPHERADSVWRDLDEAFSTPVSPSDHVADYTPTQIIAELFKQNGYGGIMYRSRLGTGRNIALFDIKSAMIEERMLFKVKSVSLKSEEQDGCWQPNSKRLSTMPKKRRFIIKARGSKTLLPPTI